MKTKNSKLALVCVGGGSSSRFGGDKLAEPLGAGTVLAHSLGALSRAFPEAPLVVVVRAERLDAWCDQLQPEFPKALFVSGGPRRQDSVRVGVEAAAEGGAEVVAVHDAARPLVHPQDVLEVVGALGEAAGAILSAEVSDTVKRVDDGGMVVDTVSRERLRLAQTPQVFRVAKLIEAWRRADFERVWTDEAALLEWAGQPVHSVLAKHPNPKLTTDGDLQIIRALLGEET